MSADDGYDSIAPADVYMVFAKGQTPNPRVLWRMTIADAQAVCSEPVTAGMANYQNAWMLQWTCRELVEPVRDAFITDDGRFADLFDRLGVTVLMSRQTILDGTAVIPLPPVRPVPPTTIPAVAQLGLFGEEENADAA